MLRDQFDPDNRIPARLQPPDHLRARAAERDEQAARLAVLARRGEQKAGVVAAQVDWLQRRVPVLRRLRPRPIAQGADALRYIFEVFEPAVSLLTRRLRRIIKTRSPTLVPTSSTRRVYCAEHPTGVIRSVLASTRHPGSVPALRIEHPDRAVVSALPVLDRLL